MLFDSPYRNFLSETSFKNPCINCPSTKRVLFQPAKLLDKSFLSFAQGSHTGTYKKKPKIIYDTGGLLFIKQTRAILEDLKFSAIVFYSKHFLFLILFWIKHSN